MFKIRTRNYTRNYIILFLVSVFIVQHVNAQFAGGSYNGYSVVVSNPCAYTAYNVYQGGTYDGNSVVVSNPCAYTAYNIYSGGSYDGEVAVISNPCAYTAYNIYPGGSYDGEAVVVSNLCAYTAYNVYGGGSCGGEYASVQTCPTETWNYPTCATRPSLPLPIELLYFTATLIDNKKVLCEWKTETEINNDYFTVEKTKDDIQYEFVGKVKGAGNSNITLPYQLIDAEPYPGTSYYRLKQTDFNGAYTYSQLVPVNLNGVEIISIFPNPAHDKFEYEIGSVEKMTLQVRVINMLGQITINETENIDKGISNHILNVSTISSGTYILQIITENKDVRGKQFQIK